MKTLFLVTAILIMGSLSTRSGNLLAQNAINQDTLVVLWTSSDKEQAMDMILWYTSYAKSQDWWKSIIFITWGPSNNLIIEEPEIQESITAMIDDGIEFFACKGCADKNQISDKLIELGITVIYVGDELTHYLKGGYPLMTF